ncbi:FIG00432661: hypothetical protein [plant metagenome]
MRTDLFCRVVDNYGDIGVCWRLARRLAQGHGWPLRLWVDDLASFARLEPAVDLHAARQVVQGVEVIHWSQPAPDLEPGEVAIEAFACDPPTAYVARMAAEPTQRTTWINLEYLSAEDWVGACHGLPSPQSNGLRKAFFFPGFTPETGGLLREPDLLAQRDAWQASREPANAMLRTLGVTEAALGAWQEGARLATLFCYPHAPWAGLLQGLAQAGRTVLLVPQGVAPGLDDAAQGTPLHVARIPFVRQPDFDRLLWSADLNIIRGEDSFVRALWAGRPLVWQIYPQDENAHLDKLAAWQDRHGGPAEARRLNEAWNTTLPGQTAAGIAAGARAVAEALHAALSPPAWQSWQGHAWQACQALARQEDLADALVRFCLRPAQTG